MRSPRKTADKTCTQTDWSLIAAVLSSPAIRTVYLYGPPGVGKTYAAYFVGRVDPEPAKVTLTEDTPVAELRGFYRPGRDGLEWHDGPMTRAMRLGARLVVNEVTHGPAEVFSYLHPVLESIETAQLTLPTNETVRPAEGFHVVCTDNAPPDELPAALRDRFDALLAVQDPHPDALRGLDAALRKAALRGAVLPDERRVGVRQWLAIQRLQSELGRRRACEAVLGKERGALLHEAIVLADAKG